MRPIKFLLGSLVAVALLGLQGERSTAPFARAAVPRAGPDTCRVYLPVIGQVLDASACYVWWNQIPLQDAVNGNDCVLLQAGLWQTHEQIEVPSGHRLMGKGTGVTILQAVEPWLGNGVDNTVEAVVHNNGGHDVTVAHFTIDANSVSTFGIGSGGMTILDMQIKHAKCDGVAISEPGLVLQSSIIEENGTGCRTGLPAAGIYAVKPGAGALPAQFSPIIVGNTIRYNGGPGVDIDRVWGGTFCGNTVQDNQAWAAFSLYSAGYWTIEANAIYHVHSADPTHPGHPRCMGGPAGTHTAALSICQDTGAADHVAAYNIIRNNRMVGWYGILLVGNDEANLDWVPRHNTVEGNDVYGSRVGCADDHPPGQGNGDNLWTHNNCQGTPNTPPDYF